MILWDVQKNSLVTAKIVAMWYILELAFQMVRKCPNSIAKLLSYCMVLSLHVYLARCDRWRGPEDY